MMKFSVLLIISIIQYSIQISKPEDVLKDLDFLEPKLNPKDEVIQKPELKIDNTIEIAQDNTVANNPTETMSSPVIAAPLFDFTGKYKYEHPLVDIYSTVTSCDRDEETLIYTCTFNMKTDFSWIAFQKDIDCKGIKVTFGPLETPESTIDHIVLKDKVEASIVEDSKSKCLTDAMKKAKYDAKKLKMFFYPNKGMVSSEIGPFKAEMKIDDLKSKKM